MKPLVLLAAVGSIALLATAPPKPATRDGTPVLPRPELLRAVFSSVLPLAADYWWIQTIQAVGRAFTGAEYREAYYYGDLATDLDPDFETVYDFVAVGVPHHETRERWVNVDESNAILAKGSRRFPGNWRYKFLAGYNTGFLQRRYQEAGELFAEAGKLGAPASASSLATRFLVKGSELEGASRLAETLEETAPDAETRAFWQKRRKQIELEGILRSLDEAVARYRQQAGRQPENVHSLVAAGLISAVPEDPLGGTIQLNPDGEPYSTSEATRLELYETDR